jgi:hypothetical protein
MQRLLIIINRATVPCFGYELKVDHQQLSRLDSTAHRPPIVTMFVSTASLKIGDPVESSQLKTLVEQLQGQLGQLRFDPSEPSLASPQKPSLDVHSNTSQYGPPSETAPPFVLPPVRPPQPSQTMRELESVTTGIYPNITFDTTMGINHGRAPSRLASHQAVFPNVAPDVNPMPFPVLDDALFFELAPVQASEVIWCT